jgi:hypothetical protein
MNWSDYTILLVDDEMDILEFLGSEYIHTVRGIGYKYLTS